MLVVVMRMGMGQGYYLGRKISGKKQQLQAAKGQAQGCGDINMSHIFFVLTLNKKPAGMGTDRPGWVRINPLRLFFPGAGDGQSKARTLYVDKVGIT